APAVADESGGATGVHRRLVPALRVAAAAAPRPEADRLRRRGEAARSGDLRLVVRLVATCDRALDESVLHARDLRADRHQPHLDDVCSGPRARVLTGDVVVRTRRLLQRGGAATAGGLRMDRVPPLPLR